MSSAGGVSTVSFVIGAAVSFGAGIAYAVTRRAWADYREKKESLPGMRKEAWAGVRATIKAGALGLVILALLVAWLLSGTAGDASPPPPTPSATKGPR